MFVYIGSRTTRERNARGEGISICHFNEATGQLKLINTVKDLVNPSYLAISHNKQYLYVVHGDMCNVSAFKINPVTGDLQWLDTLHCGGKNPVHLALDPTDRYLIISNHLTGNIVSIRLTEDGKFERIQFNINLPGKSGPHRTEQPFSKPHYNAFDLSRRFVIVPDKGLDKIFCFHYDNGKLIPSKYPSVETREGAGPRHYVQHPNQKYIYVINELDSSIATYTFDQLDGKLTAIQNISTLSNDYVGNSRAASILLNQTGEFLYASNRGENSIALFQVNASTGKLKFVETFAVGGKTPRCIALSPNGKFIFSLNEDSHNISIFHVDCENGTLRPTHIDNYFGSPVNMEFLDI
ncbi:lactonase family protein [Acinetobacter sp. MB5]|uniref:lactonase family protein n=1 Tax=Acinetobacter sp. MB5 TaxID=2069438 RepID=UPI000DD04228|nr:lactonase family protein [Acinetobacter sp. MB5]